MFAQSVLACACAAMVVSVAADSIKCSDEVSAGTCNPSHGQFTHHDIPPGQAEKGFPAGRACDNRGGVTGLKAVACDYDVAPMVVVPSIAEALVYRRSNLAHSAGVTITVCCNY